MTPEIEQPCKKARGQYYTTKASYILNGFSLPSPEEIRCIIEPFAGQGDLLEWINTVGKSSSYIIEAYDIEPKSPRIQARDTLRNPPNYENAWVITNPPYLARNKSQDKSIYNLYDTNDLYKCFIYTVLQQTPSCRGGIWILPAGFFFSPRDIDVRCRGEFMKRYKITRVNYFEETVFNDTTTTIVAFAFEVANEYLYEQLVEWHLYPKNATQHFKMSAENDWIIGGDIYKLPISNTIKIRRYVVGQPLKENEQQTYMTLNALDTGTQSGRIALTYEKEVIYPAKESSRSFATLRIQGIYLDENEQIRLCNRFNVYLEEKRTVLWSLFLPQYRESKEYARKRIPFDLAYRIVGFLIMNLSG